jgi:predicted  nucleic acid-binding Zn-ribbon protein
MIDEKFLQSAVNIRRTYLKMSSNMDLYQKSAADVVKKLDKTLEKIEKIRKEVGDKTPESSLNDILGVIKEIEDEGKRLEDLISPLNKEIEKLALEEQELYRKIKEKHNELTDDQIIESVKQRLIKENLS